MTVHTGKLVRQASGIFHPVLIGHEAGAIAMTITARALVNAGEPGPRTGFADQNQATRKQLGLLKIQGAEIYAKPYSLSLRW